MIEIHASAHSTAGPDTVYALLIDPATWPDWSPMDAVELEVPGTAERLGVGSVRLLTRGRIRGHDQVVELVPGKRFSYVHLSGLPVRDYRSDVELEPTADGTDISWRATFRPRIPGTGWFLRIGLRRMLGELVTGLAAYAAAP
jgi:hypothetical protein